MRNLFYIIIAFTFLYSCEKSGNLPVYDNMDVTSQFILDQSINISINNCAGDFNTKTFLCLDSVLNDSRCPSGAICIWAGDAEARFKFALSGNEPVYFTLHPSSSLTDYKIVNGYKFTMKALFPYPSIKHHPGQSEYRAEIIAEKITR